MSIEARKFKPQDITQTLRKAYQSPDIYTVKIVLISNHYTFLLSGMV